MSTEKPMDRDMARALTDAGYMPVSRYVELFGEKPVTDRLSDEEIAEIKALSQTLHALRMHGLEDKFLKHFCATMLSIEDALNTAKAIDRLLQEVKALKAERDEWKHKYQGALNLSVVLYDMTEEHSDD